MIVSQPRHHDPKIVSHRFKIAAPSWRPPALPSLAEQGARPYPPPKPVKQRPTAIPDLRKATHQQQYTAVHGGKGVIYIYIYMCVVLVVIAVATLVVAVVQCETGNN